MQESNLSFYHLGIAPRMLSILERKKFVKPTPIQHKAIPIALEGKDIVGIAQTGTGKTLAFGIPMVQRLVAEGGRAVILVPTRELASQVEEALRDILREFNLQSTVIIGGVPIFKQTRSLQRHPHVIIATPGRLYDHMGQRNVELSEVKILILDEADRMFDMGFAPQVNKIIRAIPRKRQTMLFSATMDPNVLSLASQSMQLPVNVEIAPSGTTAKDVTQELFIVKEESAKRGVLRMLLEKHPGSVLIFTRTKIKAKKVTRLIREMNHNAVEIHSDRSMAQRKQAIEGFKSGRFRILVATDIAARGIDVSMIELVVNYDLPEDSENYVHRIGRTGRAGETGHAVSIATVDQGREVASIERLIQKSLPRAAHPELALTEFRNSTVFSSSPRRRSGGGRGGSFRFSRSRGRRR